MLWSMLIVGIDHTTAFIRGGNKVAWKSENKFKRWVFVFQKYGEYLHVLIDIFIERVILLFLKSIYTYKYKIYVCTRNKLKANALALSYQCSRCQCFNKYLSFSKSSSTKEGVNVQPSLEIRDLYFMKWSNEILHNLSYFWNMKTHDLFLQFPLFFSPLYLNTLFVAYYAYQGHFTGTLHPT